MTSPILSPQMIALARRLLRAPGLRHASMMGARFVFDGQLSTERRMATEHLPLDLLHVPLYDLDDPATVGCLAARVRFLLCAPHLSAWGASGRGWLVMEEPLDVHDASWANAPATEGEAWLSKLESIPAGVVRLREVYPNLVPSFVQGQTVVRLTEASGRPILSETRLIGRKVYHPNSQTLGVPRWHEGKIDAFDEGKLESFFDQTWPDGFLVRRARFVDEEGCALHYAMDNLYTPFNHTDPIDEEYAESVLFMNQMRVVDSHVEQVAATELRRIR